MNTMVKDALDTMDAAQLREVILDLIQSLDDSTRIRLTQDIVDRAVRTSGRWSPGAPDSRHVEEIEAFAAAAKRIGYADPSEVDAYLHEGSRAFLARDYVAATRIFRALLPPIGCADIDLGQDEMIIEVLGIDIDLCAKQHMVAAYMLSSPGDRVRAVIEAINEMEEIGYFFEPLHDMEEIAIEPLTGFEAFISAWRAHIEALVAKPRERCYARDEERWLREVVARTEGGEGLASLARSSTRPEDLRTWCNALVAARDWHAAYEAFEEAASLVEEESFVWETFLDGAALAAQESGIQSNLDAVLERAWRQAPSLTRLRRLLGRATTREKLVSRAKAAQGDEADERQRALLHLVCGEFDAAAALLRGAPGLGWSEPRHPGHLLFPVFTSLLDQEGEIRVTLSLHHDDLIDALISGDAPRLHTPTVREILRVAALAPPDEAMRTAMIEALRAASRARVEGVASKKRRGQYEHAASLAVQCAHVDGSEEGRAWLEALIDAHRRYPALRRAFDTARRR